MPLPPVSNPFPPPWEQGPAPADPAISAIATTSYAGSGYGAVGTGKVGTINRGANTPVNPGMSEPTVRFFLGQDGNLYALARGASGLSTFVIPPTLVTVQPPTSYPPTSN